MKVFFKGPRVIDGVSYMKGAQEVDKKLLDHWFFKAMVQDGFVKLLEEKQEEIEKKAEAEMPSYEDLAQEAQKQKSKGRKKAQQD